MQPDPIGWGKWLWERGWGAAIGAFVGVCVALWLKAPTVPAVGQPADPALVSKFVLVMFVGGLVGAVIGIAVWENVSDRVRGRAPR